MYLDTSDAQRALRFTDWSTLLAAGVDTSFPVMVDGEPVTATVVDTRDNEDYDNDRKIHVVVRIGDQYFKKEGWGSSSSYCSGYGDDDESWESGVTEVRPVEKKVVYYEV